MSVTPQNSFNVLNGDGTTTVFTWTFALPAGSTGSEIQVYIINASGTPVQITSNFSLNVGANQITYPVVGGISPLGAGVNALPAGWSIALLRVEPLQQNLTLETQGVFPAASVTTALDALELQIQQLQEQLNRCVKYPIGQVPTTTDVTAFIAAVSATILSTPVTGTYAYVKGIAAVHPTQWMFAIVTDQGAAGENQLFFYSGDVSVGDYGWFGPVAG